jgi:tetratricopeptide (TPR) repeat protein
LKKYDAAILLYSKILKQAPLSEKALIGRAKSYANANKYALAEKDFKDAIAHNPGCISCYLKFGLLKLIQNDTAGATANANEAIRLDNKNSEAWLLKARIAITEKKYADASAHLAKAIDLDKDNADAYLTRATLSVNMQLPDIALRDFDEVIRLKPDYADAYAQKGNIYAQRKQWDDALKYYLLGAQRDSLNAEYYKTIGSLYSSEKKDFPTALNYFARAIRLNDKDGETYVYRGDAYYWMEDMDASCSDYKAALQRLPPQGSDEDRTYLKNKTAGLCDSNFAEYYYQRGIANYNLDQFEKAVAWYNKGMKKFPENLCLFSFRAASLLKMNKFDEAESDYNKAIALKDKVIDETANYFRDLTPAERQIYIQHSIAENFSHRAEVRLALKNYAGAMNDIDEALKEMPANEGGIENFYFIKAAIYLEQGDNNSALTWLNKSIHFNPGFGSALVDRALVKLNLAYRTTVTQRSLNFGGAPISLPAQTHSTVNTDNLESALTDCNKAIGAEPKNGYAYYVRAMIKLALKQADYCYDFLKAEQLGYEEAKSMIQENKCR